MYIIHLFCSFTIIKKQKFRMIIYTSYYGNLKKLQKEDIVSVGISQYTPKWFKGMSLQALAPTKKMLYSDITEEQYTEMYLKLLEKINFNHIIKLIKSASQGKNVALLCYERPGDFCHRHILAKYLNEKFQMNIAEFIPKAKVEDKKNSSQKKLF